MSAPLNHSSFTVGNDDIRSYTVNLWRGAMMDRFARTESTVFLCIRALYSTGAPLPADTYHDGAKARLRALAEYLEKSELIGAKSAAGSLRELMQLMAYRTGLAHGVAKDDGDRIEFEWVRPGALGSFTFERKHFTFNEMLAELSALDKLQRDISSQLGMVRKAALERAKAA